MQTRIPNKEVTFQALDNAFQCTENRKLSLNIGYLREQIELTIPNDLGLYTALGQNELTIKQIIMDAFLIIARARICDEEAPSVKHYPTQRHLRDYLKHYGYDTATCFFEIEERFTDERKEMQERRNQQ